MIVGRAPNVDNVILAAAGGLLGLTPLARVVSTGVTGLSPEIMGYGPVDASNLALELAGMSIGDIDLVEINEAFASVVAAWRRELDPDMDRVNVNGGAIALGHPLGMSGARLVATAAYELERNGKKIVVIEKDDQGKPDLGKSLLNARPLREFIAQFPLSGPSKAQLIGLAVALSALELSQGAYVSTARYVTCDPSARLEVSSKTV